MTQRIARFALLSVPVLWATAVWADGPGTLPVPPAPAPAPAPDWFIFTVIFIVLIGILLALIFVRAALGNSKWSMADALSEEVEVTATKKNAAGDEEPMADPGNASKFMMITEMRASSSRLIALIGMLVILLMFIGFGMFSLYRFATSWSMPTAMDSVIKFLVAGLTLFAPYVVNKFSSMFESLTPKKP